jgi:hypothetical protein
MVQDFLELDSEFCTGGGMGGLLRKKEGFE